MWKDKARNHVIIYVKNLSNKMFVFKRNIPR